MLNAVGVFAVGCYSPPRSVLEGKGLQLADLLVVTCSSRSVLPKKLLHTLFDTFCSFPRAADGWPMSRLAAKPEFVRVKRKYQGMTPEVADHIYACHAKTANTA